MDKNAGSVFEQRTALARLRAHLRDEVRNRAGRACHGWRLLRLSDLTVFPEQAQCHSETVQPFFNAKTRLATGFCFISSSCSASSAADESASTRSRLIQRPSRQWPPIPQRPLQ